MNKSKLDKLDAFEETLKQATLNPGTVSIDKDTWSRMYSLSLGFANYDEQEHLGEYLIKNLLDFARYWSTRLEDITTNNQTLIEEFSKFWSSTQLYIFIKQQIFETFLSSFCEKKFAAMVFENFISDFFKKQIPRICSTVIYLINQDRKDINI